MKENKMNYLYTYIVITFCFTRKFNFRKSHSNSLIIFLDDNCIDYIKYKFCRAVFPNLGVCPPPSETCNCWEGANSHHEVN